ncbi:hypothetical protein AC579_4366 [Pseudocercospora musae]|uniref:Only prolin and serin are matching in the corresponding protein n=1 Tax=Pseudocercospora musae TaxID=113226 RepID=A0A139IQL6_9PEZI|nr:hypothetical protein AC579_4366 [Pseudocercospora musae]
MSTRRSLSFPRINTSKHPDERMSAMPSPHQFSPTHSRDSSAGSTTSSPITPTFSTRGHSRWPSSSSSLLTNPDSPANPNKTQLHDLVEDPSERDGSFDEPRDSAHEPLCICDTPFCEHRREQISQQPFASLSTPEWTPGDDYFETAQLPPGPTTVKRRRSGEFSSDTLSSRLSRHFPSISKRFGGHRSTASVTTTNLPSAPGSRSSSLRLPSTRSFTMPSGHDSRNCTPPFSPAPTSNSDRSVSPPRPRPSSHATRPVEITLPTPEEDPIDREELASTPLLPPMMASYFNDSSDAVRSPLQSPTVASPSAAASITNTPSGTPVFMSFPTPPLSTKQSMASLHASRSSHVLQPSSEIPPLSIAERETDPWAIKLGHANFHIKPEPYLPEVCDAHSCKQLLDDWEAARVEFMRQAVHISEHYGVTSQTYRLTEQKWAEIDAVWRTNHEMANTEAQVSADNTFYQPLAETQAILKMPSLEDPSQPSKFPKVEEADIVGPMVQYAKIQHRRAPSRKQSFLKIFTDPTPLFGPRANLGASR